MQPAAKLVLFEIRIRPHVAKPLVDQQTNGPRKLARTNFKARLVRHRQQLRVATSEEILRRAFAEPIASALNHQFIASVRRVSTGIIGKKENLHAAGITLPLDIERNRTCFRQKIITTNATNADAAECGSLVTPHFFFTALAPPVHPCRPAIQDLARCLDARGGDHCAIEFHAATKCRIEHHCPLIHRRQLPSHDIAIAQIEHQLAVSWTRRGIAGQTQLDDF